MKELIIIRGASGSGKSSLAHLIHSLKSDLVFEISADDYFTDMNGNYEFNPHELKKAHEYCKFGVNVNMKLEAPLIIVHNTFTQDWEMEAYEKMAKKYNYTVRHIIVEYRHNGKNIHGVPFEVVEMQKKRFSIKL